MELNTQNPKKSTKAETWLALGDAYTEAGTIASTGLYRGMDEFTTKILMQNPEEGTETINGVEYVKYSNAYLDVYLKDMMVQFWRVKRNFVDGALEKGVAAYQKAYELDSASVELLQQISDAYASNDDYEKAIDAYKKYCEALPAEERTMENTFQLGRLYYSEGTATDTIKVTREMRQAALIQADTIFAEVAAEAPDSYLGNFWRARTNSAIDPETTQGLAKPYYEKVVEMLLPKNDARYNRVIIECYKYLGYYFLLQSDYETSKDYWNKILAIDPNDTLAKTALEGIEKEGH